MTRRTSLAVLNNRNHGVLIVKVKGTRLKIRPVGLLGTYSLTSCTNNLI